MTKWAQVNNNGSLTDLVEVDPATLFHPDIAAAFEIVPDNVTAGHTKDSEGNFIAPTAEAAPTVNLEINLSEGDFLAKLTRAERQAITTARSSNADLEDFMTMLEKRGFVTVSDSEVQSDINAFVSASIISQASADAIIPS
tara:strand:- start:7614 stop:8036 length:423 start_codon:yes stop_codon:yes gene_type:complete